MYSLDDKIVLVTGASSGIGRATARAFAAAGAHLVLVARRAAVLEEVKEELAQYGKSVLVVPTDLTREDDLQRLYETLVQTYARIDVLVNNAGMSVGGELEQQDADKMRQMVLLNVYAPMRLTQLLLPLMLAQRQGHIVNISSVAGVTLSPGIASYSATRSAMLAFSQSLRREVSGRGVRVSTVLPGWTATAMTQKMDFDAMSASGVLPPLSRVADPAVPARAIVNVVRYNRPRVVLGGLLFLLASVFGGISPLFLDGYYFLFFNKQKALEVLRNFG